MPVPTVVYIGYKQIAVSLKLIKYSISVYTIYSEGGKSKETNLKAKVQLTLT